eukprot:7693824-Ditylum_brightwellii.AAC.1
MAAFLVSHRTAAFFLRAAHGAVLFSCCFVDCCLLTALPPLFSQTAQVVVDWMWQLLMRLGGGVKNGVFYCFGFWLLWVGGNGVIFL